MSYATHPVLRQELLAMEAEDLRVRKELLEQGDLGDGYHPDMREVHQRNASRLKEIIAEHGWPGRTLAGTDTLAERAAEIRAQAKREGEGPPHHPEEYQKKYQAWLREAGWRS